MNNLREFQIARKTSACQLIPLKKAVSRSKKKKEHLGEPK